MELFECSEYLKLSRERESRNDRPPLGESASPFIGEGDGLTSLERKREKVYVCFLVLLPTLSGTRRSLVPTTLFMSDACGRLYRVRLVWQMSVPTIL